MEQRTLTCYQCGLEPTPELFLSGIRDWWPWIEAGQHACSRCGRLEEVLPENGRVIFGYVYAAAIAHYAGMEETLISGLVVERVPGALRLTLGSAVWEVPAAIRPEPPDRRTGQSPR